MEFNAASATLIAAVVAAIASTVALALRIRADARAELRQAHRDRLAPLLEELGDALHKIVACSVLAVRDAQSGNRAYFDVKKREAPDALRRLRPKVRYQLWGIDDGLKTLIALPDWIDSKDVQDYDRLLAQASNLRLAIDNAIRRAYDSGSSPSLMHRLKIRINARRMWDSWSGLQQAHDLENVGEPDRDGAFLYPKTRAIIIRRDDETFIARSEEGTEFQVRAANRTGKGSRSLAQPGVAVNVYKREGEDFFRYRFAGKMEQANVSRQIGRGAGQPL